MRLVHALLESVSLSRCQSIIGLVTGILSIAAAVYPFMPSKPKSGEVVMFVRDARSDKPIADASVEILTVNDALVTTLTPEQNGRAREVLKEGTYRVRVSHPRFGPEMRQVEVMAGHTAEVRVTLNQRPTAAPARQSSPLAGAERAVNAGVGQIRRLFE